MCGIVGFIDPSIPEDHAGARLGSMLRVIEHRGPDGEGAFQNPVFGLALGMRRLSIIDLENGGQPIWNETQSICAFFNGEIYNYIELRAELTALGHRFRTNSDTEVLVHSYEHYGSEMVHHLRGMFTFAIYDQHERVLFLARDHFGQKPLYFCTKDAKFAFASEIKSLLQLPWVPRDLDHQAFFDFMSWHSVPAPQTHFSSIAKLPAGYSLKVGLPLSSLPSPVRYWRYPCGNGPAINDMEESVDALDHVLEDSIRLHLRSDVPVGVLLSSGLDSRAVAAYAVKCSTRDLQTFSVGFSTPESEHLDAAASARELGTRHHTLLLEAEDLARQIDTVAWHLDEPVGDPAAFALLLLCRLARQHVKVVLGGEGADELLGGYAVRYDGMIRTLARTDRLRWLSYFLPRTKMSFPRSALGRLRQRIHSTRGAEVLALRVAGFPGDIRSPHGFNASQLRRLRSREQELSGRMYEPQGDILSEITAVDVGWQLADSLLLKSDKMSMAASIELRCPFLDIEVAKTASRIASALKLAPHGGPGKMPLRRCLNRKFPEPASRAKKGFPIPLAAWLAGPLRSRLEGRVFGTRRAWGGFLDADLVRKAWTDFLAGKAELAPSFYALWLYEAWHEGFGALRAAS